MGDRVEEKKKDSKQHKRTRVMCVTVTKDLKEEIDAAVASGIAASNSELVRVAVSFYLSQVKRCPPIRPFANMDNGKDEFGGVMMPGRQ